MSNRSLVSDRQAGAGNAGNSDGTTPAQKPLSAWVDELEAAGLLTRYSDEKRVDELPELMEQNPDTAILVEHVKDCDFPFLANAYGARSMYALALGCPENQIAQEMIARSARREAPEIVETAPCKDVILRGEEVDLTKFPLFLYHPRDGQAYLDDTNVMSRDPDTGLLDQGFYRFMYRSRNETGIDMRNEAHNARVHAVRYRELGQDMPIAVVIGAPTLDKIASMVGVPGVDDWEILGGFYGEPARVVKCETNDLTVPANAEIVIEGRVITTEGWVHDEGPFGEGTGTYGRGLPRNNRVVVDCITHRRDAIYQFATIGGMHPGRVDVEAQQIVVEVDIYQALQQAGILVQDVYFPPEGCSNIGYAQIKTRAGGDAKQALSVMLAGSRQWLPKIAYVFDEDVDIRDPERVQWAFAWRFNPGKGTLVAPDQNTLPLDPTLETDHPPLNISKIGFDCTIPLVGHVDPTAYDAATVSDPLAVAPSATPKSEEQLTQEMRDLIQARPRTWKEVLEHFADQPYPVVYRAFGNLRPELGRLADERPFYPYTISDSDFVYGPLNGKPEATQAK